GKACPEASYGEAEGSAEVARRLRRRSPAGMAAGHRHHPGMGAFGGRLRPRHGQGRCRLAARRKSAPGRKGERLMTTNHEKPENRDMNTSRRGFMNTPDNQAVNGTATTVVNGAVNGGGNVVPLQRAARRDTPPAEPVNGAGEVE